MLDYPFSSETILQSKRALKKKLLAQQGLTEKRVAILSGTTIGETKNILELFLLNNGIKPVFHEGEYGRFFEEAVFENQTLKDFAPDFVYLHTGLHNLALPAPGGTKAEADAAFEAESGRFAAAYNALLSLGCAVIANNFEFPRLRVSGNYEAVGEAGSVRFVNRMNLFVADFALEHQNFYLNDLSYLAAFYGIDRFSDPSYYNAYKYAQTPDAIPALCHSVSNIMKSILGKNKKALMLDLDNTLWGGVIGDDGVEGIKLGTESPEGMAYMDMQAYAKQLKNIGVVLGVCSKNEEAAAKGGFAHPSSVLTPDDFAVFYANWNDKAGNLAAAASSLNIGADSLVFADDNPAEREIVRRAGLGIAVPELTLPERFAETVANAGYFEVTALSEDDRKRAEMYKQNAARQTAADSFTDYGAYLQSLNMKAYFGPFTENRLERVTQLANKTNQFNLTTRRYSLEEMRERAENTEKYITLYGRLEDKFGDNGLVSEIVGEIAGGALDIELWIMSCRVFKRELEFAMFDKLVSLCKQRRISRITGSYFPTAKNPIVREFYASLGFQKTSETPDGESRWVYDIPKNYTNKTSAMEVQDE